MIINENRRCNIYLIERMKSEYAKIDGNVELLHRAHVNLAKRINLYIGNDGKHIDDIIRSYK